MRWTVKLKSVRQISHQSQLLWLSTIPARPWISTQQVPTGKSNKKDITYISTKLLSSMKPKSAYYGSNHPNAKAEGFTASRYPRNMHVREDLLLEARKLLLPLERPDNVVERACYEVKCVSKLFQSRKRVYLQVVSSRSRKPWRSV